jgi:hypothetical protein
MAEPEIEKEAEIETGIGIGIGIGIEMGTEAKKPGIPLTRTKIERTETRQEEEIIDGRMQQTRTI